MSSVRVVIVCALVACLSFLAGAQTNASDPQPQSPLRIDPGHFWRPPFGVERVGQPTRIVVETSAAPKAGDEALLVGYHEGQELLREQVKFEGQSPATKDVDPLIDRVVLLVGKDDAWRELASLAIERSEFEADAEAKPKVPVNPIDLGAVFPPADWLVLSPGQRARVRVVAFRCLADTLDAHAVAWFDSRPGQRAQAALRLSQGKRSEVIMDLPEPSFQGTHDTLWTIVQDPGGKELWRKRTDVMLVREPPVWPRFGASETLLRYDLPISIRDHETGTLSTVPYEDGWSPQLKDVVVSLPNGSRFVFWRGSSYVPFWAGRANTGLAYEWAETGPLPEGFVDCVEPLMDKELRYARVRIIESTSARVHVRWTYQSCDFNYKVWGDSAQEDFYFYPDGFGTRVLTITSALDSNYEVSEFIVLAPPEGYPFDVLPPNPIRCLGLDGAAMSTPIPFVAEKVPPGPVPPIIYRVQFGKEESGTAVYFTPRDPYRVEQLVTFRPFYERGYMVTPAYWGSHWPLARGKTTGWSIDDRLHVSPSHNSLMSWERHRPEPVSRETGPSIDTLGRSRQMQTQRWVWLIGMTDEPDDKLIARARSFSEPASLDVEGAELGTDSYALDRRAYQLTVTNDKVAVTIKPTAQCVNPVFEFHGAPGTLATITSGDRYLSEAEYAWDGQTLWLNVDIGDPTRLRLEFKG